MRPSILAALAAAVVLTAAAPARAEYPERPITLIVPWAAGGGTDATGRIMASLLERDLGVPVNVVNRTGGSGVVGHTAIATAEPDGYTIGVVTVEIGMMHWQGLTELTYRDFTFLAQPNQDSAGVMVDAGSDYETVKDLLDAVKDDEPGEFNASGTGQGGIWHLALAGWMLSEGLAPDQITWVPSDGASAGLKDLVAGGVEVVTSSLAEGRALIDAERVRPIATMSAERVATFPDVPTLKEATGSDWTIGAWRTIGGPKGLPPEVVGRLAPALKAAYDSKEFQDFMANRGFGVLWRGPEETTAFVAAADRELGDIMKQAGLAR